MTTNLAPSFRKRQCLRQTVALIRVEIHKVIDNSMISISTKSVSFLSNIILLRKSG